MLRAVAKDMWWLPNQCTKRAPRKQLKKAGAPDLGMYGFLRYVCQIKVGFSQLQLRGDRLHTSPEMAPGPDYGFS